MCCQCASIVNWNQQAEEILGAKGMAWRWIQSLTVSLLVRVPYPSTRKERELGRVTWQMMGLYVGCRWSRSRLALQPIIPRSIDLIGLESLTSEF